MSNKPSDLFDVSGKVVMITGGSRGLGRAMALEFGRRGASLAIASRKIDECEKVAAEIRSLGADAMAITCHVGQWGSLDKVIDEVVDRFGRIDVLVNNAGMSPLAPSLLETSEVLFDKIIAVNLKGPTRLTALAATKMAQSGGGSIINISSVASLRPSPMTTVYSAAKAGLNALTAASAQEYASSKVRVNCIICGTFDTDAAAGMLSNDDIRQHIIEPVALQRVGGPDEVVGAAIYFASNASSYTTGTTMTIDGGVRP